MISISTLSTQSVHDKYKKSEIKNHRTSCTHISQSPYSLFLIWLPLCALLPTRTPARLPGEPEYEHKFYDGKKSQTFSVFIVSSHPSPSTPMFSNGFPLNLMK